MALRRMLKQIRDIYLLQRKANKVGAGLGKTSGWVHRATLQRNQVKMMAGVEYKKIDDQGLHISVGGQDQVLDVDRHFVQVKVLNRIDADTSQ